MDVDEQMFKEEAQKAQQQTVEKRKRAPADLDMFDDTVEADIFAAESPDAAAGAVPAAPAIAKGLVDSYDDAEGYYNFQVGVLSVARSVVQQRVSFSRVAHSWW
jgi:hypothetical protein